MIDPSLSEVFSEARLIEDAAARKKYLEETCGKDAQLLSEAQALLKSHDEASDTFSSPLAVLPEVSASRATEDDEISLPYTLGNYILEETVGKGGMGVIYRATETKLERVVALKMIKNAQFATRQEIQRFHAEAKAAAHLSHPGIVPVYEIAQLEGQHFFTMGYVEGINLAEAVRDHSLSTDQAIYIIKKICDAVSYAHEQSIVHRDLKPENILLSNKGLNQKFAHFYEPQISDFGLAKRLNQDLGITIAGEIFGTPSYMSPEQASGSQTDVTKASDIYSIGALLYFLLAGKPPFGGQTVWDVLQRVKNEEPKRLRILKPAISKDLETICHKCLEKDPNQRYQTAQDILADLENHQNKRPLIAKPVGSLARFAKLCRRHPTATLASLLAFILILSWTLFTSTFQDLWTKIAQANDSAASTQTKLATKELETELQEALQKAAREGPDTAVSKFLSVADLAQKNDHHDIQHLAHLNAQAYDHYRWKPHQIFPNTTNIQLFEISPNGDQLATLSKSGDLIIYDTTNRAILLKQTLPDSASVIAFHPSGQFFVTGFTERTLRVWQQHNGTYLLEQDIDLDPSGRLPNAHFKTLGFSTDGSTVFFSLDDQQIHFWKFPVGTPARPPLDVKNNLIDFDHSLNPDLLFALAENRTLHAWDTRLGQKKIDSLFLGYHTDEFKVSPDGKKILAINKKSNIARFFHVENDYTKDSPAPQTETLKLSKSYLSSTFGQRTSKLLVREVDHTLQFHEPHTFKNLSSQFVPGEPITDFRLSNDEAFVFIHCPQSRSIQMRRTPANWGTAFSLPTASPKKLSLTGDSGSSISLNSTDLTLTASPFISKTSQHFPLKPRVLKIHRPLQHIHSDQQSHHVFVLGEKNSSTLYLIDGETLQKIWQLPGFDHSPTMMGVSPDGKFLALLSSKAKGENPINLSLVEIATRQITKHRVPTDTLRAFAFSSMNPHHLVIASDSDGLLWFDWKTGKTVRKQSTTHGLIRCLDVCHSRNLIVVGTEDRSSIVFHEENWAQYSPAVIHQQPVIHAHFLNNGNMVISGDGSHSAKLWQTHSGRSIGPPLDHHHSIVDIQIREQADTFATVTSEGTVKFWPIPKQDLKRLSEAEESP